MSHLRMHGTGRCWRRCGFTLLEVLVVVLIITILATVVGVKVMGEPEKAKVAAATAQIENIKTALRLYRLAHNVYPTQDQGLLALVEKPTVEPIPSGYPVEGYLDSRGVPLDPWGSPYLYMIPATDGTAFEVLSYGADGEPGGEAYAADISSLDL